MTFSGEVPLSVPELRGNEWLYVKECLDTNWVSSVGPFVERFERAVAVRSGARHAVATSSGTAALHVALLVLGIGPGDEVVTPALTFIAPANAVRYVGAWPVFVDAEPDHWQLDPRQLALFLERGCKLEQGKLRNKATGRHVRAVLPVHLLGHPCDMAPIVEIARRYELAVVEDATESLGALYEGRPVGSLGDVACFSFNGNKIVTTGGGGMLVTDRESWAKKARYLTTQAKDDPLEYVHAEVGFNYRLTNVLAAIGCAQLERLDDLIAAKRRIAARYREALAPATGLAFTREAAFARSVEWLFTILVEKEWGEESRRVIERLGRARIQARPLWQPLHRSKAHEGAFALPCPVADRLHRDAVSLPSSSGLSPEAQEHVIRVLLGR
jgi:perosamine synthetase